MTFKHHLVSIVRCVDDGPRVSVLTLKDFVLYFFVNLHIVTLTN
jgi:hypothetical protein